MQCCCSQPGTEEMGELATCETFQFYFLLRPPTLLLCFPAIVLAISFPKCLLEKTSFSKYNYTCYVCVVNTLTVCCKLSRHLLKECLLMSASVSLFVDHFIYMVSTLEVVSCLEDVALFMEDLQTHVTPPLALEYSVPSAPAPHVCGCTC